MRHTCFVERYLDQKQADEPELDVVTEVPSFATGRCSLVLPLIPWQRNHLLVDKGQIAGSGGGPGALETVSPRPRCLLTQMTALRLLSMFLMP